MVPETTVGTTVVESCPCSIGEIIVSVVTTGLGLEVGVIKVGIGKGHPALCMPSCINHIMISCDGIKRENEEEDDDDEDD